MHSSLRIASPFALFSASVCNNGFSCPSILNLLWVIWPLTSLLSLSVWHGARHCIMCHTYFLFSLFCVLPSRCPQSGTRQTTAFSKERHPARRPFSLGTKPTISLQICFSVVYISVSRVVYTYAGWAMQRKSASALSFTEKTAFLSSYISNLNWNESCL